MFLDPTLPNIIEKSHFNKNEDIKINLEPYDTFRYSKSETYPKLSIQIEDTNNNFVHPKLYKEVVTRTTIVRNNLLGQYNKYAFLTNTFDYNNTIMIYNNINKVFKLVEYTYETYNYAIITNKLEYSSEFMYKKMKSLDIQNYNTYVIKDKYTKFKIQDNINFIDMDSDIDVKLDFIICTSNDILKEVKFCLDNLRLGGKCIIKVKEIVKEFMVDILYILSLHFNTIDVFKPMTTLQENSEKYIICTSFIHRKEYKSITFNKVIDISKKNYIYSLFLIKELPEEFKLWVYNMNNIFMINRISHLIKMMQYKKDGNKPFDYDNNGKIVSFDINKAINLWKDINVKEFNFNKHPTSTFNKELKIYLYLQYKFDKLKSSLNDVDIMYIESIVYDVYLYNKIILSSDTIEYVDMFYITELLEHNDLDLSYYENIKSILLSNNSLKVNSVKKNITLKDDIYDISLSFNKSDFILKSLKGEDIKNQLYEEIDNDVTIRDLLLNKTFKDRLYINELIEKPWRGFNYDINLDNIIKEHNIEKVITNNYDNIKEDKVIITLPNNDYVSKVIVKKMLLHLNSSLIDKEVYLVGNNIDTKSNLYKLISKNIFYEEYKLLTDMNTNVLFILKSIK